MDTERQIMSDLNAKLRQIMAEHNLTRRETARLLSVPTRTLDGWLAPEGSPSHRRIRFLAIITELEHRLGEQK